MNWSDVVVALDAAVVAAAVGLPAVVVVAALGVVAVVVVAAAGVVAAVVAAADGLAAAVVAATGAVVGLGAAVDEHATVNSASVIAKNRPELICISLSFTYSGRRPSDDT